MIKVGDHVQIPYRSSFARLESGWVVHIDRDGARLRTERKGFGKLYANGRRVPLDELMKLEV